MKRACAAITWVALFAIWSQPALAEDEIESERSGPYIGINLGAALANFDGEYYFTEPLFNAKVQEIASIEVVGRVGWRLLPYLAVEAQYDWIRQWEIETKRTNCAKVDAQFLTGNVRLFAPIDAIHPYALVGLGIGSYEHRTIPRAIEPLGNGCSQSPNVPLESKDAELYELDKWGTLDLVTRLGIGLDVYITRHVVFNLESSTIYSRNRELGGEKFPYVSVNGGFQLRF